MILVLVVGIIDVVVGALARNRDLTQQRHGSGGGIEWIVAVVIVSVVVSVISRK